MAYHISNFGSFAGSASDSLKPAYYADIDGFVPQPGDNRRDFNYEDDSDEYVGDTLWDEWVELARQATVDAENDARGWRT